MREYHPNYIALIRYGLMYYISEESAKQVRQIESVREYIWDTGDIIAFEVEKLDNVLPKLIKAGRGVITCDIIEDKPKQDDYPPEPYNESDTGDLERPCNELIYKYSDHERHICDHKAESANSWGNGCLMLPYYLRQKVFPAELFNARCKISRFKPRYFSVYTNYYLCKERALERKRNANTSVYRVLIRGET